MKGVLVIVVVLLLCAVGLGLKVDSPTTATTTTQSSTPPSASTPPARNSTVQVSMVTASATTTTTTTLTSTTQAPTKEMNSTGSTPLPTSQPTTTAKAKKKTSKADNATKAGTTTSSSPPATAKPTATTSTPGVKKTSTWLLTKAATTSAPTTTTVSATTTTPPQPTTTPVPTAPDTLIYQNLLKVRQCSCQETEACAFSAFAQIGDCKQQCAGKMEYFGEDTDKMTGCFVHQQEELKAFDQCLRSTGNFCTSDNSSLVYVDVPDYSSFVGNQPSSAIGVVEVLKAGVLVKKARKAFAHFRSFQKCVASCLKQQIVHCYGVARCAVPVPHAAELSELLDGCSQMKVHDHVHTACDCLVQKQQIR